MIVVTLEGLPHSGKRAVIRSLVQQCPDWKAVNVAPEASAACTWAGTCRSTHALFSAMLRKVRAISLCGEHAGVVLLNMPWIEHLPRHPQVQALAHAATRELLACLPCKVDLHVMVLLRVHHDETFEQMVCCGNPIWNHTSLEDVRVAQDMIAGTMTSPFPSQTNTICCPPFFDETEVVTQHVTQSIVDVVEAARLATPLPPAR